MRVFLLMICIGFCCTSYCQEIEEFDLEAFTEKMFSVQTTDINYEDLYEQYLQWTLNPLDLNSATDEELRSLYILTNRQIDEFFSYRDRFGKLLSITELQVINGFDLETIHNLRPFIKVSGSTPRVKPPGFLILESKRILEQSRGHLEGIYKGDAYRVALRGRVHFNQNISLGISLEKDAGESFNWSPKDASYGADFTSFNIQARELGLIRNLIIGDYQAQFGQGLVLGSGFFLGKGAETVSTVRRSNLGIRPYTSMVESSFMRGMSFTMGTDKLQVTPLISYTQEDGKLQQDTSNLTSFTSRILTTGFHRTESEIESKGNLKRLVAGLNMTYNISQQARIGVTSTFTRLNKDIQPSSRIDNQFQFRGSQNSVIGLFGSYNWRNLSLFAEAARSRNGGYGLVAGGILSLSRDLDVSWSFRKYERHFHSLYGSMFSEASNPAGEQGVYIGIDYRPVPKVRISGYWDRFYYPWLRYRVFGSSEGHEGLIRISYNYSRQAKAYLQVRREAKTRDISSTSPVKKLSSGLKTNYLFNTDYPVNSWLSFKTRVQFSTYVFDGSTTEGIAFMQDFTAELKKFTISGRVAVFDTEDYENRQYSYEKDILYNFSIPAYSGQGLRTMLLIKYKASRSLSFWFRAAQTVFDNVEVVGSGLDEIAGNRRTEVKLQGRYTF